MSAFSSAIRLCIGLLSGMIFSNVSAADVFLKPGESIYLGGQRVYCENSGSSQIESRTFRCEPMQSQYPSLDSRLQVTTRYTNGRIDAKALTQFHYRNDCDQVADELSFRCRLQSCNYQYCEADDSRYSTLNTTMYNIRSGFGGDLVVERIDHFSYMRDCEQALRNP